MRAETGKLGGYFNNPRERGSNECLAFMRPWVLSALQGPPVKAGS